MPADTQADAVGYVYLVYRSNRFWLTQRERRAQGRGYTPLRQDLPDKGRHPISFPFSSLFLVARSLVNIHTFFLTEQNHNKGRSHACRKGSADTYIPVYFWATLHIHPPILNPGVPKVSCFLVSSLPEFPCAVRVHW